MPEPGMQFSNRVGQELFQLLAKRGTEQLNEASDFDWGAFCRRATPPSYRRRGFAI